MKVKTHFDLTNELAASEINEDRCCAPVAEISKTVDRNIFKLLESPQVCNEILASMRSHSIYILLYHCKRTEWTSKNIEDFQWAHVRTNTAPSTDFSIWDDMQQALRQSKDDCLSLRNEILPHLCHQDSYLFDTMSNDGLQIDTPNEVRLLLNGVWKACKQTQHESLFRTWTDVVTKRLKHRFSAKWPTLKNVLLLADNDNTFHRQKPDRADWFIHGTCAWHMDGNGPQNELLGLYHNYKWFGKDRHSIKKAQLSTKDSD